MQNKTEHQKALGLSAEQTVEEKENAHKIEYNLDGTPKTEHDKNVSGLGKSASDIPTEHANHKKDGFDKDCPMCECETCRNRRYQDASDDSGVSFQNPTKMNPVTASYRVKAHEMEHVRREQFSAKEEGKKVISQSVQIKTDICPECGKIYVSGGTTRTRTKEINNDFLDLFKVGAEDFTKAGNELDETA